ncbi:MAG TPA: [FeFe] hydrogenase H-cluster maturation GTPase HydF [Bacteroidales bacterium]|nr:[FeFe] hydrogenase H-cluster maturation GTPase HydF [Bacteroidales bacterium]
MNKGRDQKPHIGIFGRRNNGKSSFINTLVGQEVSIVSERSGTTTDPVKKSIEIFGIGPVIMVDTAGIDDTGELGEKRVKKTLQVLATIDCAILIIANNQFGTFELNLIRDFKTHELPFIIVHNKSDLQPLSVNTRQQIKDHTSSDLIDFSTLRPVNMDEVIDALKKNIPETSYVNRSLIGDLISEGDYVLLVTPIDSEAPEGRMILPQQMAIRDVLDNHCICIVLRETELKHFFETSNITPRLVITDSQAFGDIKGIVPEDVPLTSFSIVFSRLKGDFDNYIKGAEKISRLKDGDNVMIMESCTHRISCEDIGRTKLPAWLQKFTGKKLNFTIISGMTDVPENLTDYSLLIQCGGCMFTRKQILNRLKPFTNNAVSITNYGMAIAYMNGIFERALQPFFLDNNHLNDHK